MTGAAASVDRARVLAYRVAAQGLSRDSDPLAVVEIGVQDTPAGSARLALAARGYDGTAQLPESCWLGWTMRGAPHLHPAADFPRLAAALWPMSDADALAKIAWQRSRVQAVGMSATAALAAVANAMRKVITGTMVKGAASAAVTAAAPPSLSGWCRSCQSHHVFESLFRLAALPAGMRLEPGVAPATLTPIGDWPGVPDRAAGTGELIRAYLRFLGPAGPADVAGFLGSTQADVRRIWPDDVVRVEVDGRAAWLPRQQLDALLGAPAPRLVRLLPPSDPFLQARDRNLLLPDRAAQKALWKSLGAPGALLVDGEIAGIWRPRSNGRKLRLTITTFGGGLIPGHHAAVEAEAQRVADVRGADEVEIVIGGVSAAKG
jgi:Winged helix DNA-binding domain